MVVSGRHLEPGDEGVAGAQGVEGLGEIGSPVRQPRTKGRRPGAGTRIPSRRTRPGRGRPTHTVAVERTHPRSPPHPSAMTQVGPRCGQTASNTRTVPRPGTTAMSGRPAKDKGDGRREIALEGELVPAVPVL